jgi:hypothetical protein
MKTTLACLLVALLWNVAATQTVDWFNQQRTSRVVALSNPRLGHWATLFRCNMKDLSDETDPACTMIVSAVPPVVTRIDEHKWQVTFIQPQNNY